VIKKVVDILKGGKGSGNFGHSGRPGERGGSGDGWSDKPEGEKNEIRAEMRSDARAVVSNLTDTIHEIDGALSTNYSEGYSFSPSQMDMLTDRRNFTDAARELKEIGLKVTPKLRSLLNRAARESKVAAKYHERVQRFTSEDANWSRKASESMWAKAKSHYGKSKDLTRMARLEIHNMIGTLK